MGVGQELTNGLKGVGHVFSFMLKRKKSPPPPHINNDRSLGKVRFLGGGGGSGYFRIVCEKSRGLPTSWNGLMHDPSEYPNKNI